MKRMKPVRGTDLKALRGVKLGASAPVEEPVPLAEPVEEVVVEPVIEEPVVVKPKKRQSKKKSVSEDGSNEEAI